MEKTPIEKCIDIAKEAGCPKDQVRNFISSGYIPLPWQWQFHAKAREADNPDGPVDIGVGGSRGPGKSFCVLSQSALDDCQRIDNLKGLFLRQTGSSAKESFDDLVDKTILGKVKFERSNNVLRFPNGSRIVLGGFQDERDIDKYIGVEYDFIIIEELTQITAEKLVKLKGSLRTSKQNWRPRIYTSFNPGGRGHQFVKENYVIPYRESNETATRFVPATHRENIYLNKEYIDYLNSLDGDLGKAWRDGEWDLFAGQFFNEWAYDTHVVEPFKIPDSWTRIRGIDPSGRNGTTACYFIAIDSDGNVYVTHEHYKSGMDSDEHAREIHEMSFLDEYQSRPIPFHYTVIDSAAFSKLGLPETIAEVYERNGVTGLVSSSKNRTTGWDIFHQFLRHDKINPPKLKVFKNCGNLIRTIPLAIHDEKKPEDILNTYDGAEHNDALDCMRYILQTLRERKSDKPLSIIEKRIQEMEQKNRFDYSYRR